MCIPLLLNYGYIQQSSLVLQLVLFNCPNLAVSQLGQNIAVPRLCFIHSVDCSSTILSQFVVYFLPISIARVHVVI